MRTTWKLVDLKTEENTILILQKTSLSDKQNRFKQLAFAKTTLFVHQQ